MGYTKIVQYGEFTEIYEYDKQLLKKNRKKKPSKLAIKRHKDIRYLSNYTPTQRSVNRAKTNFFRLCHHNNVNSDSISLFTLTFTRDYTYNIYGRKLALFINKLNKHYECTPNSQITYIGVPELTKKGRYHYHLLIYNLPPTEVNNERNTRNFQRLYGQGYLDVRLATDTSPKIAGYMAKYMAKHFSSIGNAHKRAYNCSRKIKKISSHGSNTLFEYADILYPDKRNRTEINQYEVPYMGTCIKTVYKNDTKI